MKFIILITTIFLSMSSFGISLFTGEEFIKKFGGDEVIKLNKYKALDSDEHDCKSEEFNTRSAQVVALRNSDEYSIYATNHRLEDFRFCGNVSEDFVLSLITDDGLR